MKAAVTRKQSRSALRIRCTGLLALALAWTAAPGGGAFAERGPDVQAPGGGASAAAALTVLDLSGTVLLARRGQAERALRKGEALLPSDRVKVRKASSLLLADADGRCLLHSYSSVRIEGGPVLVYGKMQRTAAGRNPVFDDVRFSISPRPAQGRTVRVILRSKNALNISAAFSDGRKYTLPLRFFPAGEGVYRALSGFDVEARPGRYTLSVRAEGPGGDLTEIRHPFTLAASVFERGKVYLSSDALALLEPSEAKTEEREALVRILSSAGDEALWNYTFRPPVEKSDILSAFGRVRLYYVNGKPAFNRPHRGIDLRGERGDYVIAPNSGVIAFSGMRITTGNTIVIDHGQGVFSLFFHLDTLYEKPGAYVVKGQRIGEIGATGITEGAHLHWGMFVNGAYVDPLEWLKREF
jgi:murein DD-endopeptidase MepM/ murein hydrolase activator NlpD